MVGGGVYCVVCCFGDCDRGLLEWGGGCKGGGGELWEEDGGEVWKGGCYY